MKRSYGKPGYRKIYVIVDANTTLHRRYLLERRDRDGSPWTYDITQAWRVGGFEGVEFLDRALERGLDLALEQLDDCVLSELIR
ncbi:hypothetical protein [Paraburkholderia adhaesiva]|uniref:hypothetical protein n=1 Tax=Paraburkholderia adhaesiva TaxID=2883244 RepID=UPI001F3B4915|nr:hypothetical protein [Paraburkholderia adhaesiva]